MNVKELLSKIERGELALHAGETSFWLEVGGGIYLASHVRSTGKDSLQVCYSTVDGTYRVPIIRNERFLLTMLRSGPTIYLYARRTQRSDYTVDGRAHEAIDLYDVTAGEHKGAEV